MLLPLILLGILHWRWPQEICVVGCPHRASTELQDQSTAANEQGERYSEGDVVSAISEDGERRRGRIIEEVRDGVYLLLFEHGDSDEVAARQLRRLSGEEEQGELSRAHLAAQDAEWAAL